MRIQCPVLTEIKNIQYIHVAIVEHDEHSCSFCCPLNIFDELALERLDSIEEGFVHIHIPKVKISKMILEVVCYRFAVLFKNLAPIKKIFQFVFRLYESDASFMAKQQNRKAKINIEIIICDRAPQRFYFFCSVYTLMLVCLVIFNQYLRFIHIMTFTTSSYAKRNALCRHDDAVLRG